MLSFLRRSCLLMAMLALVALDALCQTMVLNQSWLPAASGSDPLKIAFPALAPDLYQLLAQGSMAVRWNGQFLPARLTSGDWYGYPAAAALEFTVPATLRTPGLTEFVLWNTVLQQPSPYRGWVSVVIPTHAAMFESDVAGDRVVTATPADGSPTGSGGQIGVYALSTGILMGTVPVAASQRVLAFTPDTAHAWIVQDEGQGQLARVSLSSGQIDQQLQVTGLTQPYTLTAQVYRPDPRILMVSAASPGFTVTRAYTDGSLLPNVAPTGGAISTFAMDDRARILMQNGQACGLSATAGFMNCAALIPNRSQPFATVWKNKGIPVGGGEIIDLTTGATGFTFGLSGWTASYLPESNRLFWLHYSSMIVADSDSLELWADVGAWIPSTTLAPPRTRAPDWILLNTDQGPLIGHMPQLAAAPSLGTQGPSNAATGQPGALAAGEILSIYGQNLGPVAGSGPVPESGLQLATEVEGTKVLFDGTAGAILYASTGQINVVVPETVQDKSSVSIQVVHYGIPSARTQQQVAQASPGIFGYAVQGRTYALAVNTDERVQGPGTPLRRGTQAVFYATGIGLPAGETAESIGVRAAEVAVRPSITMGGVPAQVVYAGVAPGLTAGVTQLNVFVPAAAPIGSAVEVVMTLGSQSQRNIWVAIQ